MKSVSICAAALSAFLAASVQAGGITPLGAPFRIDASLSSINNSGGVAAMRADGSFVAAWAEGAGDTIVLQRYATGGTAVGTPIAVGEPGTMPQLALNRVSGDFAVAWTAIAPGSQTRLLRARLYHADGTPLGASFRLDDDAHNYDQLTPVDASFSIALDGSDRLLAAWPAVVSSKPPLLGKSDLNMGVLVRRYSAAGAPLDSAAHDINQGGLDLLTLMTGVSVGSADDGHYVAAWGAGARQCIGLASCPISLAPMNLRARQLDAGGQPKGLQASVLNGTEVNLDAQMQLAVNASGEYAIAWVSGFSSNKHQLHSRAFTAAGLPRAGAGSDVPAQLNTVLLPSVSLDPQGDYVVAYESQAYVYTPTRLGGMKELGAATAPISHITAVSAGAGNQFVVVGGGLNGTTFTAGFFGQLYSFSP